MATMTPPAPGVEQGGRRKGHNGPGMDSYSGPVRILDAHGILLTVGRADLERDPESNLWRGLLRVFSCTGVAGKAVRAKMEVPGGGVSEAVLDPRPESPDGVAFSDIAGIGPAPF